LCSGYSSGRRSGRGNPLVLSTLVIGVAALVGLVVVEGRVTNPMLPLELFRSRCFAPANVLTLFLYAALTEMVFLVPLELIQVQRYTATAAGAMLLPFPIIMFAMSRWSGGLIRRVGHRLPLTVGPLIAAIGLATFAIPLRDTFVVSMTLLAIVIFGIGMAITVAPPHHDRDGIGVERAFRRRERREQRWWRASPVSLRSPCSGS
jgi:fucose permease